MLETSPIAHPDLVRALETYRSLMPAGALPHRSVFGPAHFRWMVGRMYLLDVGSGLSRYRFRLFGDFWQSVYGIDMAGHCVGEIEACEMVQTVRESLDFIVQSRRPSLRRSDACWPTGERISFQRLILPFAGDEGEVSLLAGLAASDIDSADICCFRGDGYPRVELGEELSTRHPALALA